MKLNVLERINLLGILPPTEGSLITYAILSELKKALSFNEKEIKDFEIKQEEGRITWEPTKEKEKDIVIGEQALIIIQAALKKVDAEEKVNDQNISLFIKFPIEETK